MNADVDMTLDEAVTEVLALLTGLDLTYQPELDRYRVVTRLLNRALRANALEQDWSYYSTLARVGTATTGLRELTLPNMRRARILDDDAVRLLDKDDIPVGWAYFLPREALHKYAHRVGLWCSVTRRSLLFSRPFTSAENGLSVVAPVMREPRMFTLPDKGETVPDEIREQLVDFDFPDVVIARAAALYASSDPVMQPRFQVLEDGYKNLMYSLIERDTRHTDNTYINDFHVPVEGGLYDETPTTPRPLA